MLADLISSLPGYKDLSGVVPIALAQVRMADREYAEWLSRHNGAIAFQGALRLFPSVTQAGLADLSTWNSLDLWKRSYRDPDLAELMIFSEDAFGAQFALSPDGTIARYWSESGELEHLGLTMHAFFEAIRSDPDGTISIGLHGQAAERYGFPALDEHFAFKVETVLGGRSKKRWDLNRAPQSAVLGGELSVANLERMNAVEHMNALGVIARQIRGMPVGTKIDRVTT